MLRKYLDKYLEQANFLSYKHATGHIWQKQLMPHIFTHLSWRKYTKQTFKLDRIVA